jgi:hypothetical protein
MPRRTDDQYIDEDNIVIPDGGRVKVPVLLMDSRLSVSFDAAAHQPGYRCDTASYLEAYRRSCADVALPSDRGVSDADVRAARSAWIEDTTAAWKADARRKPPDDDGDDDDDDDDDDDRRSDSRDARTVARDAYVKSLSDAWRTPPARDAAQPDLSTPPDDLMRRHTSDPADPAAAQARKDAAYRSYATALSSAWRNPPGVTPSQNAVVGPGPRSMVVEPARGRTDPARAGAVEEVYEKTLGQ